MMRGSEKRRRAESQSETRKGPVVPPSVRRDWRGTRRAFARDEAVIGPSTRKTAVNTGSDACRLVQCRPADILFSVSDFIL